MSHVSPVEGSLYPQRYSFLRFLGATEVPWRCSILYSTGSDGLAIKRQANVAATTRVKIK